MQQFDFDLLKDNDSILIIGGYGEDGIIGYWIGRQWKNTTLYRYETGEILDSSSYESDEGNGALESRVICPSTKSERKPGRIYITIGTHGKTINITQEDNEKYDWIIKVCPKDGGFAPFILHSKRQ